MTKSARQNNILEYGLAADARPNANEELWARVAHVLVPVAYWGFLAAVGGVFVGALVLWGMLIALVV